MLALSICVLSALMEYCACDGGRRASVVGGVFCEDAEDDARFPCALPPGLLSASMKDLWLLLCDIIASLQVPSPSSDDFPLLLPNDAENELPFSPSDNHPQRTLQYSQNSINPIKTSIVYKYNKKTTFTCRRP